MSGWGGVTNPFTAQTAADDSSAITRSSSRNPWGSVTDIPLDDEPAPASARQTYPTTNNSWAADSTTKTSADRTGTFKSSFASFSPSELATKAQELEAREEAVRRREAELAGKGGGVNSKNWPFFMPVLYHDINAEVPVWNRSMVRWAYRAWLVCAVAFIVNLTVILVMAFAGVDNATWGAFFVAVIATGIGLPLSFFGWYRRLYYAAQTDGAVAKYIMFLMMAFLHLAWCIWVIVSVPNIGRHCAGLFNYLFKLMSKDGDAFVYAIMCAINIGLWGLAAIGTKVAIARGVGAMRSHDRPRLDYERRTGQAYQSA